MSGFSMFMVSSKVPVLFLHALECVVNVSNVSDPKTKGFRHKTTQDKGKDLALLHMECATVTFIYAGAH